MQHFVRMIPTHSPRKMGLTGLTGKTPRPVSIMAADSTESRRRAGIGTNALARLTAKRSVLGIRSGSRRRRPHLLCHAAIGYRDLGAGLQHRQILGVESGVAILCA